MPSGIRDKIKISGTVGAYVSAQEAVYRLLSLPMKQLSRSVVFTNMSELQF